MASLQDQFLKALMERFSNPALSAVIEALPEELSIKFKTLPEKVGKSPESFLVESKRVLLEMHPSWYSELIQLCPSELQPSIRSAIEASTAKESHKKADAVSPPLREFLLNYLVSRWPERGIQGREYIEGGSFPWLVACDEQKISKLTELLAVNDVVDIVRQTVDRKMLQKILRPFSQLQQRYLRSCLHRPVRSATLKKELTALLLEDPQKAQNTLLERGLEDLGLAMKDEPPLFIWHVFHHIDKEKASFLKQVMERKGSPQENKGVKKHLSNAYQFLQKVETQ